MDAPSTSTRRAWERFGGVLFRWRSFTPLLLLLVAAPLIWRSRGDAHAALWFCAGLLLCASGQALRAWVIGQAPDGTSGQSELLMATELNTAGPYAYTRNPLYLGNLLLALGLCLVAHDVALLVLVAALFAAQYGAIIAAEEQFLRERFGAAFDDYRARVPRFWPRPPRGATTPRPWSLRRVIRKEHNPAAAWISLTLVLLALDRAAEARRQGAPASLRGLGLGPYVAALALLGLAYFMTKGWKHRWFSGGFTEDLRRRLRESPR